MVTDECKSSLGGNAMDWQELIVKIPGTAGGHPIIKGTRITVHLLLEQQACGATEDELLKNYPTLYREGVRAAFAYADAHGTVAYEDWDTEFCPYHGPDGAEKTSSSNSI